MRQIIGRPLLAAAFAVLTTAGVARGEDADREIERFAHAYRAVLGIQARYAPQAHDVAGGGEVYDRANQEMRQVIERSGLTPTRYNDLVVDLAADSRFRDRVTTLIEETAASDPLRQTEGQ